jgi:tRNA threonylcarbamoyladenosine biosynthesis protein TsaB
MILAIDTATRIISLALRGEHDLMAETTWSSPDHHTTELGPAVDALMARAQVASFDLTAVAVALGPGSFTGLRIGLAAAKGIALASGGTLALVGVPTLDIIAAAQPHPAGIDRLCALVQAGRGRVSAGLYIWREDGWRLDGDLFLVSWSDLINRLDRLTLVSGEIDPAGRTALMAASDRVRMADPAHCLRRAGYLAEIAAARFRQGQTDDPATLAPLYLH